MIGVNFYNNNHKEFNKKVLEGKNIMNVMFKHST